MMQLDNFKINTGILVAYAIRLEGRGRERRFQNALPPNGDLVERATQISIDFPDKQLILVGPDKRFDNETCGERRRQFSHCYYRGTFTRCSALMLKNGSKTGPATLWTTETHP